MVRAIRLSIEAIDQRLNKPRRPRRQPRLGVPDRHAAARGPGMIAGLILAFAKALGEFGATYLRRGDPRPDPDRAGGDLRLHASAGRRERRAAAEPVAIAIALLAVVASELLTRRVGDRAGSRD